MNKTNKFSPEVRERAVRMVQEHRGDYPSLWSAVEAIAPTIGCVPQTLLAWVKRADVDAGVRPGVSALAIMKTDAEWNLRPLVHRRLLLVLQAL